MVRNFAMAVLLVVIAGAAVVACDKETANDPKMQEAKAKMKSAADQAAGAAKQAGEAIKVGAEPIIDAGKRATTRAAEAISDGADKLKTKVHDATGK